MPLRSGRANNWTALVQPRSGQALITHAYLRTHAMSDQTTPEPTPTPAAPYVFPFEVPSDLAAADDTVLRNVHAQVREHAQTFAGLAPAEITPDTLTALSACRALAQGIRTTLSTRGEAASQRDTDLAAVDADLPEPAAPAPPASPVVADDSPAPVDTDLANQLGTALLQLAALPQGASASRRGAPSVRAVAARSGGMPQIPAVEEKPRYAAMVAASGTAGFASGSELATFNDAAALLSKQLTQHPSLTAGRAKGRPDDPRRPVTVYGGPDAPARQFVMSTFNRIPGVEFRREFPESLRVLDGDTDRGYAVAEYAASERRLPGGNLIESARLALKSGRALVAAAGWCAASETIYDLCELETTDGLLDVPEMQTSRGGWNIPIDGGPDFATIFNALGNAGDTHLTEAEVIADTAKLCTEIPCPDFEDIRLGVDYVCLTGGLLQRRGYPEVVARWSRGAMTALRHKIDQATIAAIVAGSGAATVISQDPNGDDAASAVLSGVHLAVVDAKYRNRMGFNSTLEVVLPWWVLVPIKAGLARRNGIGMLSVTDEMVMEWFAQRGAVPRFVYNWQDAFTGLAGGPGGVVPLSALPPTAQFLIYPAGTWVRAMQSVVSLDTIYDSTRLGTNEYTAIFAEDGHAMLQMCPLSRLYTVNVDPGGVVGCCDPVGS